MPSATSIKYLKQGEIDKRRWDACIAAANNGLMYAYSFYLDHMAGNWDALVLNDYEAVMPLPWRKKFGIYYLYQPFLVAQMGVFGKHIGHELLSSFLQSIPSKFRLWEFPLNYQNVFDNSSFNTHQRVNYVLSLDHSYENLFESYRQNHKRNIKKALQYGCHVNADIDIRSIVSLSKAQSKNVSEKDFQNFLNLYQVLNNKDAVKCYGVFSKQNKLIASCVFTFSHNRAYYILVGNHPDGRTLGASHLLIDTFIKDHAGKKLLLDFEGSDARNLAFFYSGFGAKQELYAAIKLNKLPWYTKLFKC